MASIDAKRRALSDALELAKAYSSSGALKAASEIEIFLDKAYKKLIEIHEDSEKSD
jgi:hypothetical protein